MRAWSRVGGYSVIEFVITVAILAVLGLVGLNWMGTKNRTFVEAVSNMNAIRSAEVSYFAEWNVFVANQAFTPVRDRRFNDRPVRWDPGTRFSLLGFSPEGPVVFSYSLEEGPDFPRLNPCLFAQGDLDADGDPSFLALVDQDVVKARVRLRGKVPEDVLRRWENECESFLQRARAARARRDREEGW